MKSISENEHLRNCVRYLKVLGSVEDAMGYLKDDARQDFFKSIKGDTKGVKFKTPKGLLKYQMEKFGGGWIGLRELSID